MSRREDVPPEGTTDPAVDDPGVDPADDERLRELIDALVELGLDEDAAEDAVREGRVPLVLASRTLEEPARYDLGDLAEATGLAPAVVDAVFVASGLQRQRYTQTDLEAAHLFASLLEVLPLDAMLRIARSRALALGAVARADMALVRDHIVLPLREAGADDLAIAVALAEHTPEFDRISRRLLLHSYSGHITRQLHSELSRLATISDTAVVQACVGFVDLVGYTALSASVDPDGLDDLLDAFEQRVVDAASTDDDVTVVKFLGDAAMFVSSDLHALVDVLLLLTTESDQVADVPIRGGLARGEVLLREGDYFGTPVNVAARLTDIARPWSLLADEALREDLRAHYDTRRIRPVRLRGLAPQRPVAVRALFDIATPTALTDDLDAD